MSTMQAIDLIDRVRNASRYTRLDCFEGTSYTPGQVVNVFVACFESPWDIYPDELTREEIAYAAEFGKLGDHAISRLTYKLG